MGRENLIELKLVPGKEGYSIFLDDKELNHVENYKIEQAATSGSAKLTLELLVKYP